MIRLRQMLGSDTGRATLLSFGVSFLSRFVQLAMSVLAARLLQPAGFGVFTFALGVGLVGGRLGALGWPVLMQRFVPRYRAESDWPMLRGLIRAGRIVVFLSSVGFGAACAGLALWLGPESHLFSGLLIGALLIPVMALRALFRNLLSALRAPQLGIAVDEFLPPAIMTLALLVLFSAALDPGQVALLYLGACLAALLCGHVWTLSRAPAELRHSAPTYDLKMWMATALPALVGMSSKLLMNKTDVLMLAPLGTMQDVGLYGAAMRVSYLQVAPVIVLSTVLTPRISEALSNGRAGHAARLFWLSVAFAAAVAVPFGAVLMMFAEPLMRLLFGPGFGAGAPILVILAVAQMAAALGIPFTSFMLMNGRQKQFGKMAVGALLANVIGNAILIPSFGAQGAAMATGGSIILLASMQGYVCYQLVKR